MVIDGRSVSQGDQIEAEVCVVGAGPAGISLALELARTGARVCILESGGRTLDAEAQKLSEGTSIGYWYYPLPTTRARVSGGTSATGFPAQADKVDGWRARPLAPIDFETRSAIAGTGWPFDYAVLEPFYERAQKICRLGPYDYECAHWETPEAR